MVDFWPPQRRGLAELYPVLAPGNSVCVASPCGGGKSVMMADILKLGSQQTLYTHRRMLMDQLAETLTAEGVDFGIRAAGHQKRESKAIQLASIQTECARVLRNGTWDIHKSDVVHIDEVHDNCESVMCELIERHKANGAAIVGWTATPLGIGHMFDKLIIAGTNSELRECGALVFANHYAPDEPDMKRFKKRAKTGEFVQNDVVKAIMTPTIFGRVLEHWRRLNPEGRPTLLFAPGVPESLWFAEQLVKNGVSAAHIDGKDVWINGTFYQSDEFARRELKLMSESGEVQIVCNRFVMREGISWNHLYHLIFATVIGSLTAYIQAGGRILRQHYVDGVPQLDHVIVQDHGGHWHRMGSLNSDREWSLDRTDYQVTRAHQERLRNKKEPEPICCPKCFALRLSGSICPECKHASHTRSRMVVQTNGTLKEMQGDIYKPRRIDHRPDVEKKWMNCYYRCKKTGRTFEQARGLYAYENNFLWPPNNLPFMPLDELDLYRVIKDVPVSRLYGYSRLAV